ncbi:MAG: hypothetical protein J6Z11_06315, partial [Candidatus Riflebacteria bacterium]|nr:hypothetical protein [Candidatus Riflebacteria bacterium]
PPLETFLFYKTEFGDVYYFVTFYKAILLIALFKKEGCQADVPPRMVLELASESSTEGADC